MRKADKKHVVYRRPYQVVQEQTLLEKMDWLDLEAQQPGVPRSSSSYKKTVCRFTKVKLNRNTLHRL